MNRHEILNTIQIHTDEFLQTKNFAYAISVFCHARSIGLSIPEEILDAMEKAFVEWGKNDGKKPLDEILKIGRGSGNKSVLSKEWTKKRNERVFCIMATLIGLGWKVPDASEGACAWLREQYTANPQKYQWLKSSNAGRDRNSESLDGKTLEGYWSKAEYKEQRRDGEQSAITSLILWDDARKENFEKNIQKWMNKKIIKKKIDTEKYIKKLIG